MAIVLLAMGFAIVGVFLPLTIYFQSVLGLDAFSAGLTIAPQPVAMMLASGPVAALARRRSGRPPRPARAAPVRVRGRPLHLSSPA